MEKRDLVVGDVVQLDPDHYDMFGGCLVLVEEPKPWGMQGYVLIPIEREKLPARAYIRATWEHMEFVGHATWRRDDGTDVPM